MWREIIQSHIQHADTLIRRRQTEKNSVLIFLEVAFGMTFGHFRLTDGFL